MVRKYAQATPYWAVGFMMAFHLFFGAIVVERMSNTYVGGHTLFIAYRALCLIIIAAVIVWTAKGIKTAEIPMLAWLLALALPLGFVVGLAHGRGFGGLISHAVQSATALIGFALGYLFVGARLKLWGVLKVVSYATLIVVPFWLSVFFITIWLRGAGVPHYSLNLYALIIPFAYFLANRQGGMALLTFILMIVVGKRSIMLAGLAMMAWFWVLAFVQGASASDARIRRWHWFAMASCAILRLGFPLIAARLGFDAGFAGALRTTGVTDLNTFSSFRGDLIVSVLKMMNADPIQWLTGSGFGSSFVFAYRDVAAVTHGVDLMPLHLTMIYGLPFTMIFFGAIAWMMVKASFWTIRKERNPLLVSIILMLGGLLSNSMFTFVSIDPIFWFALGACCWIVNVQAIESSQSASSTVS